MIVPIVVAFFGLVVGGTGPAYHEWLDRRRANRDRPLARVVYLPSARCRPAPSCPDPGHCAICKASAY